MEITNLMVGDWVFAVDCAKPNAYRVTKINAQPENGEYPIHIDRPADGLPYTFLDFDQVEPIPLTADILERNGFDVMVFDNGEKVFAYGSLCIREHKGLFTFKISDCRKRINNVHELQHALRLCGIEKEIVL